MTQVGGLLASLRGCAISGVALLRGRLGLLKVEALEEAGRVAQMLAWAVAAVLLSVAGSVFLAVFVTVLLWDTHRVLALGVFSALFLAAGLLAGAVVLRLYRQGSQLFAASLAELQRDEDALKSGNFQP